MLTAPTKTTIATVITIAGSGAQTSTNGIGTAATFNSPRGIAIRPNGDIFVSEFTSNLIRKIDTGGVVTSYTSDVSGDIDGPLNVARFYDVYQLTTDKIGNLILADEGNNSIKKITTSGIATKIAGLTHMRPGHQDGPVSIASFSSPEAVAIDSQGNVYVSGSLGDNRIRKISITGIVSTLAGGDSAGFADGPGATARFAAPKDLAVDDSGNVFVADVGNHRIRKITPAGLVSTFAGSGNRGLINGIGTSAALNSPSALTIDKKGNLFVVDQSNFCIRKITPSGEVSTLCGSGNLGHADGIGTKASFRIPVAITIDTSGKNLYVADGGNNKIRKIALRDTAITAYLWSNGARTRSITVKRGGTYTLRTVACGDTSEPSKPVQVTVYPIPFQPTIAQGITPGSDSLTSLDTARHYVWYKNGIHLPDTTQSVSITGRGPGNFTVVIVNAGACSSAVSQPFAILGTNPTKQAHIDIYPNPFTDSYTIDLNNGKADLQSIEMYDQMGRKINVKISEANENRFIVAMPELPKGIYVLQMGALRYKVVKN